MREKNGLWTVRKWRQLELKSIRMYRIFVWVFTGCDGNISISSKERVIEMLVQDYSTKVGDNKSHRQRTKKISANYKGLLISAKGQFNLQSLELV